MAINRWFDLADWLLQAKGQGGGSFGSDIVEAVLVGSVRLRHFPVGQETFRSRPTPVLD